MAEEIKEILDRLDFNEWEVDLYKVPITWSELYDIRDYITNLQKENEQLRTELNGYKSNHEKSVELIRKSLIESDITGNGTLDLSNLLNIFQGGDE